MTSISAQVKLSLESPAHLRLTCSLTFFAPRPERASPVAALSIPHKRIRGTMTFNEAFSLFFFHTTWFHFFLYHCLVACHLYGNSAFINCFFFLFLLVEFNVVFFFRLLLCFIFISLPRFSLFYWATFSYLAARGIVSPVRFVSVIVQVLHTMTFNEVYDLLLLHLLPPSLARCLSLVWGTSTVLSYWLRHYLARRICLWQFPGVLRGFIVLGACAQCIVT